MTSRIRGRRGAGPGGQANTASQATASQATASAIVRALSTAGTRMLFGLPGGQNLDVVGAAVARRMRFILAHGETAVRLRLPIVVVVFNDAALSLIKIRQRASGHGGADAVTYRRTSFADAAAAMGAAAFSVTGAAGLGEALDRALGRPGPTLIDARVDPGGYPAVMDLTRGDAGRRGTPDSYLPPHHLPTPS